MTTTVKIEVEHVQDGKTLCVHHESFNASIKAWEVPGTLSVLQSGESQTFHVHDYGRLTVTEVESEG